VTLIFNVILASLGMLLCSPWLLAQPLFDAHLHYNAAHAAHYGPQEILRKLDQGNVTRAVVTSTPAHLATRLYQQAPDRIVPLLGVYGRPGDKTRWTQDTGLAARIEAELRKGVWRGIGELHLFAEDRHSPVFRRIVELAVRYDLPLMLHADPAVIDTLYDIAPNHPVIWAHAGTFPYPDLVADYLQRYPALHIDVSMRDERIAANGEISDDWYGLLVTYPTRIMVGVDTFSLSRWHDFDTAAGRIRQWLALLPDEIGSRLAYDNAAAFFNSSLEDGSAGDAPSE
jgi:Tat protein secretion system quality control protein TatD with DNase activity